MPPEHAKEISYIGQTNFRNERKTFGIKQADRRSHMYLVGKTGTGKSNLLETLIRQDIAAQRGLALLDPHGDLAERIASVVPEERQHDLIYFNVPDARQPLGFNPLSGVPPAGRVLAASGILDAFKKIWADSWGPRLEHILRNALLALLEQPPLLAQPHATLADILRLLDDSDYRKRAAALVSNAQVRRFWLHEYERYPARLRAEAISPIQNKVGRSSPAPCSIASSRGLTAPSTSDRLWTTAGSSLSTQPRESWEKTRHRSLGRCWSQ